MSKKIIHVLFAFVILIGGLMALGSPVQAQGVTPTPTGSPIIPTPAQQAALISSDPNVVSFAQLQQSDIQLTGPYDTYRFSFSLPSDWKITPGAALMLSIKSFSSAAVLGSASMGTSAGGTLTVRLNNNTLDVVPLNTIGDIEQKINIAPSDFTSINADGSMTVDLILESGTACLANDNLSLLVQPISYFNMPHDSVAPDTSLVNFPRPIYQGSFSPESALIIIPDHPTSAELQAALTMAAGLGSLTGNALQLDMTTIGKFRPDEAGSTQGTANHLIFVGKPNTLPVLNQLHLPLLVNGSQFQIPGGGPDDGVIQMIGSPWSGSHAALVVSGNTDHGIIKAAQALSTGVLRSNSLPNLSIVKDVNPAAISASQSTDQTLADLGMTGGMFVGRGDFGNSFNFTIPPGRAITSDAAFDLMYGNSALINYDRSTIVAYVNGHPIGSVRMSDTTAGQAINTAHMTIPSAAVVPGNNSLQFRVSLVPLDNCTPPATRGLWINVWPQSNLHLPLDAALINPVATTDLAAYPAPFVYDRSLSNTAFVLPKDDLDSWRGAMRIAAGLGAQTNAPVAELSAFFREEISATQRAQYDLVVIGQPSQAPFVNDINQYLPAPFSSGSNIATENDFQVTYRIAPDSPMGYVELLPSPWNPNNVILAALGNTAQGVNWAVSALVDPNLQAKLAGNIAVVNNNQIVSTDTRIANVTTGSSSTGAPQVSGTPEVVSNILAPTPSQTGWILPVMAVAVILIVVILIVTIAGNRKRMRGPR